MNFRSRRLLPLFVALLGAISAAGNVSAQSIQQPSVIPTGNWPVAIYSADINEDGKPDLIYIDQGATPADSTTHVLLNNGDGTFRAAATIATAGTTLAIGHFDSSPTDGDPTNTHRDAHLDIGWISVRGKGVSGVFAYGNGDGTFTAPVLGNITQTTANVPNIVSVIAAPYISGQADFLFAIDAANTPGINVFYRLSFYSGALGPSGPGQLLAADLNGDGQTDFIVTASGKAADVFPSVIPPEIPPRFPLFAASYPGPGTVASTLLADADGDGRPDLITAGANGRIDVYHGNADGSFSTTSEIGNGASDGTTGNGGHLIAIADLNGDHIPDIITSTPAGISVLLGQPPLNSVIPYSPSYKLLGIYNAGPGRSSYALADFNGDGHLDLAVDSPEGIAILFGKADGSFQTSRSYATAKPADSIALGPFSGSGNTDVLVANEAPRLLAGDGKGGFTLTSASIPLTSDPGELWAVAAADFDGDGILDAAFFPQGTFVPPTDPIGPLPPGTICSCTTGYFPGPAVYFDKGTGTGQFSSLQAFTYNGFTPAALPLDYNGDGVADLANFAYTGCAIEPSPAMGSVPVISLFSDAALSGNYIGAVGYLQFGRSGKQDIVCQGSAGIRVFRNKGDGTFTQTAAFPNPSSFAVFDNTGMLPTTGLLSTTVLLQDLDGDGNGDLIVVYRNLDPNVSASVSGSAVYIYWGNGDGTFTSPLILSPQRNNYLAAVADVDGDGHPDLILSDGYLLTVLPGQENARTFAAEQHLLAGMGINNIAATTINGLTTLITANGGSVLSNPVANRGIIGSNAEVNTGGITVLLNLPGPALSTLTGTVTANPEPSIYSENFTLTATLTPSGAGVPATGTVTFSFNGTVLGTSPVINGVATFVVNAPAYAPATYALAAAYSGDVNYDPVNLTGSHVVVQVPTVTTLTNVVSPIFYGQIIADLAVGLVQASDPGDNQAVLGGTLTFFIDGVNVCVLPVDGTMRACPPTTGAGYPVGLHQVSASYSGTTDFAPSPSINYPVQILADDTQGTLTSSFNPAVVATAVTFTAVFTAPFAIPTGTVTFFDGATLIGTGTLDAAGKATLTTSTLAIGMHPITATLASSLNFNGSTTATLQQFINAAPTPTTTQLISSINPSIVGQTVTFTALVRTTVASSLTPSGTVTFTADAVLLGTVTLDATGAASILTSTLTQGSHIIVASFTGPLGPGSQPFLPSSTTLIQVVNAAPPPPSFTLAVTPATLSVPIGNSALALVTITPVGGFNQPVALTCGSLPREVTCTFGTTTIPSGNGSTQLTVFATAPHDCSNTSQYFVTGGPSTWFGLLATSGLVLLMRRRRKLVKAVLLTLALSILPVIAGCGHCTDLGVFPGNYSFTVSGASTGSPSITATQTIQMVAHL